MQAVLELSIRPVLFVILVALPVLAQWEEGMHAAHRAQLAGRYGEAAALLEQALRTAKTQGIRDEPLGLLLHNLGTAQHAAGRVLEAQQNLKSALVILQHSRDQSRMLATLHLLATIHLEQGQLSRAESYVKQTRELLHRLPNAPASGYCVADWNEARILLSRNEMRAAEEVLDRAMRRIKDQADTPPVEAVFLTNLLGVTMIAQKRWPEAREALQAALPVARLHNGTSHPAIAKLLVNLALVERNLGHAPEAEQLAREAVAILESKLGPDHPALGAALAEQAAALKKLKRNKEASFVAKRAEAILAKASRENHSGTMVDASVLALQAKP
jgi:tetratricopeptide (TPR) repeat protein